VTPLTPSPPIPTLDLNEGPLVSPRSALIFRAEAVRSEASGGFEPSIIQHINHQTLRPPEDMKRRGGVRCLAVRV